MASAAKTVYPHITKDPAVCGGRACVTGTRVRVMDVVSLHESGLSPQEIAAEFPSLRGVAEVYAALLYFEDYREEIAADFAEQERSLQAAEQERQARQHKPRP